MESRRIFTAIIDTVSLLSNSPIIENLVGDKIYPLVNTDDTEGDFIAYQRGGYQRIDTNMATAGKATFFITAVSSDYDRSLEIAQAVYTVLDGRHSEYDLCIKMIDYEEDYLDKKFVQILKFVID